MSNIGKTVEYIRNKPTECLRTNASGTPIGGFAFLDNGTKGTVVAETDTTLKAVYSLPATGLHVKYNHNKSYLNKSYRFVDEPSTATMTIESERSYALYRAQSTEVIEGFVPQVVYSEEIVWQGDPVAKTGDSGDALTKDEQQQAALKAAEDKIKEVVKKQFS